MQAKIYLCIAQLGQCSANVVSKTAHTDRAATYRVISQLEEQGFVQRVIDCPVKFRAIPMVDLASVLISHRKLEVAELEKEVNLLHLPNAIVNGLEKEDEYILLVPRTEMVVERIKRAPVPERTVNVVSPLRMCWQSVAVLKETLWAFMEKGKKVTYIVNKPTEDNPGPQCLTALSAHPNFALRYTLEFIEVSVVVVDDREVWINSSGNSDFLAATHLISNNPRLVKLAQVYFNQMLRVSTVK
jgi:hypothetical protein